MTTNETIKHCIQGDKKAQYELYKLLYTKFMGMCIRYRNDKDQATISFNNGFVKILKNLNKLDNLDVFDAWVRRILVNQMLTEMKSEKKIDNRTEQLDSQRHYNTVAVSNLGSDKLNAEYLKKLLNTLPATTKQVFNLFAIDGFSHKEIGAMLKISDGTSKWHVSEARKRLKQALTHKNEHKLKAVR